MRHQYQHPGVVPYIGTWIETEEGGADSSTPTSRTLYRYVD